MAARVWYFLESHTEPIAFSASIEMYCIYKSFWGDLESPKTFKVRSLIESTAMKTV